MRSLRPLLLAGSWMLATCLDAQAPVPGRTGGARPGIDVIHYRFRVEFPPAGPDTIRFAATTTALRTAPVSSLSLDLVATMQVDSVLVNARRAPFTRPGDSVQVALPPGAGDTVQVAVHYHGHPTDGLIIRTDATGSWTAFGDNFPDRARQWLAVVDHPAEKARVTWEVLAPTGHRVVANGVRTEETPLDVRAGAMVLTRLEMRQPIYPSVMVIGVAPFAVLAAGDSLCAAPCVPQSLWVLPSARAAMPGTFARVGEMVSYFASVVGPFPYESLAHVASSTRYGGMENAGAIFYPAEAFARGGPREATVAHEIAHQWFGDAVTEREWPDVWLSEGFATYFSALWMGHAHGEAGLRAALDEMRRRVLASPVTTALPVVNTALSDLRVVLNTNVYDKAGFTLHLLRLEVGDSAFFGGVRTYVSAYRHGGATTRDFRRVMEAAAGRDLGWFFSQWFERAGVPEARGAWRHDAAARELVLTVTQSGPAGPYRFPLSVDVVDATGRARRLRVAVPAQRESVVRVPVRDLARITSVQFDADGTMLGMFRP